jgi:hypothetical protein
VSKVVDLIYKNSIRAWRKCILDAAKYLLIGNYAVKRRDNYQKLSKSGSSAGSRKKDRRTCGTVTGTDAQIYIIIYIGLMFGHFESEFFIQ